MRRRAVARPEMMLAEEDAFKSLGALPEIKVGSKCAAATSGAASRCRNYAGGPATSQAPPGPGSSPAAPASAAMFLSWRFPQPAYLVPSEFAPASIT
jgi:hypothetical protein